MVPNSPGGGYDTTARVAAKIVEDEKINDTVEVYNLEGAGGTTGLAKLVGSKGKDGELMLMGLGVVGAVYTNQSESTLADTTPIARLISEPDILVVPADSPYETLDDLVAAWTKSPGDFPVGGGSSPGGPDHLAAHLTAEAVGVTPTDVNYVVYDGGGPLLAALLSGEVEVGRLRPRRVQGPDPGRPAPRAGRDQRRAGRGLRRPDPHRAGRGPGVHQLAWPRRPSRHRRRRARPPRRHGRGPARHPGLGGRDGRERLDRRAAHR